MNNYHIYDAIGRSQDSVVYKGRKKQTVHYVAIKSIDKKLKPLVLKEVKVLHSLNHPNILSFDSWYETSNHLWLILEYCVGGDLRSLLASDGRLPQTTVLQLARELAEALQCVHAHGTLHCSLQPSSILLDENGHVKLSGFGYSQSIKTATPAQDVSLQNQAPEVRYGGAPPSMAGDLWSLGCILYECLVGKLPNSDSALAREALFKLEILPELDDFIMKLLNKSHTNRLTWSEVCTHPLFAAAPLHLCSLPEEPAFLAYIARSSSGDALNSSQANGNHQQQQQQQSVIKGSMSVTPSANAYTPGRVSRDVGSEMTGGSEMSATPAHPRNARGDSEAASVAMQLDFGGKGGNSVDANRIEAERLVWHTEDVTLKPIVGNKRIDKPAKYNYDASLLPFSPMTPEELLRSTPGTRSRLIDSICASLRAPDALKTKLSILSYVGALCQAQGVSQVFINSDVGLLLVAMLRNATMLTGTLRARIAHILGLLLRHATNIDMSLVRAGIFPTLVSGCREPDMTLRQQCVAALGELLFYVASKPGGGDAKTMKDWDVPPDIVNLFVAMLKPGVDEVVQHYAAKTLENLANSRGALASKVCELHTAHSLLDLLENTPIEPLKATAASAVCRLLRQSPDLLASMCGNDPKQERIDWVVHGMNNPSIRVQQPCVTVFCQVLATQGFPPSLQKWNDAVFTGLERLLESNTVLLQAKAIVAASLLMKSTPGALIFISRGKFPNALERLSNDSDTYLNAACTCFQNTLPRAALMVAESTVRHLEVDSPHIPAVLPKAEALSTIINSPTLRSVLISDLLISALSKCLMLASMRRCEPIDKWDTLVMKLLECVDAISCHADVISRYHFTVLTSVLPALSQAVLYGSDNYDVCFISLKLLCDIVLHFVSEPGFYCRTDASDSGARGMTQQIDAAVIDKVLPLLPRLFESEDPMPLYALKLLATLMSANLEWMLVVSELGLVSKAFDWLAVDHAYNNVHNIRLCCMAVQAGVVNAEELQAWNASSKAASILAYSCDNWVQPFVEPTLELCTALVLVDPNAPSILQHLPSILELLFNEDPTFQLPAAQFLVLLAERYPDQLAALLSIDNAANNLAAVVQSGHCEPAAGECIIEVLAQLRRSGRLVTTAVL